MEKLKEIYDEISNFNSFGWSLDFSSLYDSIIAKLNGEPEPPREKVLTKGEKYINNAIKVNKLDLFEGTIIVPKKDYISGYHNLSFDEFCSYIYWRTLVRNKKTVDVPSGFLALYLMEIVNFVEAETYLSGLELLKYLKQLSGHEPKNLSQVNNAIEEYVIVYGSVEDVYENCDISEFDYIFEEISILKQEHPHLLLRLSSTSYPQLRKSELWEKERQTLEKNFDKYFYSVADYFDLQNIHFLKLYVGTPKHLSLRKVYIKHIFSEKLLPKEIVRDELQLIKVTDTFIGKIATNYTDGTEENKGHFFIRHYVIKYILRLYEKIMREKLGYPEINAELNVTNELALKDELPKKLFDIINSEEFKKFANQVQIL